jgi:RNA polymerase sigma factor (sigma-70 family)
VADRPDALLARWRAGDQQAADELFRRYAARLIALARSRLSDKLAGRVDPEDIVQSAYRSFFADTRDGHYDLEADGDLWQLLVTITLHKLNDQVKRSTAEKRAVARQQNYGSEDSLIGLQARIRADAPSPIEAVALVEQVEQLMARLPAAHRPILERRLQGYTLDEIADEMNCCQRTVIRVLEQIKRLLEQGS